MRAERRSGSVLGKKFGEYMSKGKLVPDELVAELIEKRLRQEDAENGAIFDGYPRTVPQANTLDGVLARLSRDVNKVIALEVPVDVILDRITGRRIDESTGQVYHLRYNPPPAEIADRVVQRKDDTEETVLTRDKEYKAKTEPLLAHYRPRGIVSVVSGVGDVEEVAERIAQALKR